MRVLTQIAIILALAAAGGGIWYGWQQWEPGGQSAAAQTGGRGGGPLAVQVLPARLGNVTDSVEAVGTARANESVVVTAKQPGNVAVIAFKEGQRVRTGELLIGLETREREADLDQAQAEFEQVMAMRDDARQRLDRARSLRGGGNVTEARIDELDAALRAAEGRVHAAEARVRALQARLDDVRIVAPFAGRVGLRQVSLGALIQSGAPITTLDDVSRIKLDFSVPETFVGRLRLGLTVFARSDAFPKRAFEGSITAIDTRVDPVTRAVRVNALFDNPDETLKPGMFLSVELVLEKRDNVILVPEEAIVPEGTRHFVFVVRDGRLRRTEVKLGARLEGEVEVVQGLAAGAEVVVRGVQRARDGQAVTVQPLARPTS
ncbi:MAG: efflux RND transporter periplasmic adaptor subunit [Proteobacteria bacterium]|nr:efflux RND transporter periplasmic adaptor subunit [Pseudomonadota bacterium]